MKMKLCFIVLSVALLFAASSGWAQTLDGQACTNPLPILSLPYSTPNPFSTSNYFPGAFVQAGLPACGNSAYDSTLPEMIFGYSTPLQNGAIYSLSTAGTSASNVILSVWSTTSSGCMGAFTLVACDQTPPPGYVQPALEFTGVTGASFYVLVQAAGGLVSLTAKAGYLGVGQANNTCDTAQPITSLPFQHQVTVRNGAGYGPVPSNLSCVSSPSTEYPGMEAFYVIGPPAAAAGRMLTVSTGGTSAGPQAVGVYQGGCPPAGSLVNCNFNGNTGTAFSFMPDGLSTYYIVVEGFFNAGYLDLSVTGP